MRPKLLKEVYKTIEGARKRAAFENAMAKGEFERGDKRYWFIYQAMLTDGGQWRVIRQVR